MSFRLQSSRRRTSASRTAFLIATILCGVCLVLLRFSSPVLSGFLIAAAAPIWQGEQGGARNGAFILNLFRGKKALVTSLEEKEKRISELEITLEALRSHGTVQPSSSIDTSSTTGSSTYTSIVSEDLSILPEGIVAGVLRQPPYAPYDVFILDVGTKDGVQVGDMVLAPNASAIGTIVEVRQSSAQALLYSSPEKSIEVRIGSTSPLVSAKGQGAGTLRIEIPRGVTVFEGERVYLPGSAKYFVGVIEKIILEPNDSFQKLYVGIPENIFELGKVVIIHP